MTMAPTRSITVSPMLATLLILVLAPFSAAASQTGAPAPELPQGLPTTAPGPQAEKWVASDGKEATPGRIPGGTSETAILLWGEVLAASRIKKAEGPTPPVTSFDLTFDVRLRTQPNAPSNDEKVNFLFMDQGRGYLSAEFQNSHRRTIRGDQGDHLFDGKEWVSLQGREDQESRRELNRWVAIARNFVALTQPAAVRLIELKELTPLEQALVTEPASDEIRKETAPLLRVKFGDGRFLSLPNAKLQNVAKGLRWLEVTSPDFRLFDSGDRLPGTPASAYRAMLGLDKDGRVRLAQFHENHGGAVRLQGALFVEIKSWKELPNGYVLPKEINTFRSDATRGDTTFEALPAMGLWLFTRYARINPKSPKLKPANFAPQ
ncbi:MAG: hypothetical protein ACI87O_002846 [Planctomycetota bacterium]|jgi:hypothetical protein